MNRLIFFVGLILIVGMVLSPMVAASANCTSNPMGTSCIDGIYDKQPWAPPTYWIKLGPIIIG
jgi:hypothetical protein